MNTSAVPHEPLRTTTRKRVRLGLDYPHIYTGHHTSTLSSLPHASPRHVIIGKYKGRAWCVRLYAMRDGSGYTYDPEYVRHESDMRWFAPPNHEGRLGVPCKMADHAAKSWIMREAFLLDLEAMSDLTPAAERAARAFSREKIGYVALNNAVFPALEAGKALLNCYLYAEGILPKSTVLSYTDFIPPVWPRLRQSISLCLRVVAMDEEPDAWIIREAVGLLGRAVASARTETVSAYEMPPFREEARRG